VRVLRRGCNLCLMSHPSNKLQTKIVRSKTDSPRVCYHLYHRPSDHRQEIYARVACIQVRQQQFRLSIMLTRRKQPLSSLICWKLDRIWAYYRLCYVVSIIADCFTTAAPASCTSRITEALSIFPGLRLPFQVLCIYESSPLASRAG
jgi:hypothetical protein